MRALIRRGDNAVHVASFQGERWLALCGRTILPTWTEPDHDRAVAFADEHPDLFCANCAAHALLAAPQAPVR